MTGFEPDCERVDRIVPSPNVNARRNGLKPEILVLHYTGLPTCERAIEVLRDPRCQVSCHYVIDCDGCIIQMVPEALRAWHAGRSSWHGETDINSQSIGIEIQNPGHDKGYPPFPSAQMASVQRLARDIITRHDIASRNVVGHSDIAPGRKMDPGEQFDWGALHAAGIGAWVMPSPLVGEEAGIMPGATQGPIRQVQDSLRAYGYDVPSTGIHDAQTVRVVAAFQRHFRPARVDGHIDTSTQTTLARLLEHVGA